MCGDGKTVGRCSEIQVPVEASRAMAPRDGVLVSPFTPDISSLAAHYRNGAFIALSTVHGTTPPVPQEKLEVTSAFTATSPRQIRNIRQQWFAGQGKTIMNSERRAPPAADGGWCFTRHPRIASTSPKARTEGPDLAPSSTAATNCDKRSASRTVPKTAMVDCPLLP